jgi:uncharacterized protein YgiM (DUF1202 family)
MRSLLCAAALLAWAGSAAADTAYVTDMLRLGITSSRDGSGSPFDTLTSGEALLVLERAGNYAHVRLEDGRDGWVTGALRALAIETVRFEQVTRARLLFRDVEPAFPGFGVR